MQYDVLDLAGNSVRKIELSDSVFGIVPNMVVIHEAVVAYLANQRKGTKSALTRAEVSGGGRKPWRQKGTGNARQGSTRAPQWRHGGVVFAPKPRDFHVQLSKKVRKLAIRSVLSHKVLNNNLLVLNDVSMDSYKTKYVLDILKSFDALNSAIVLPKFDEMFIKSANNIPKVKTLLSSSINSYDIFYHKKLIIFETAVRNINSIFEEKSENIRKVVA